MSLARVRKGDTVIVISGRDKGKTGKVLRVLPEADRVVVEKINLVKRHTKPTPMQREGGIIEKENPIHLSKVMPVDPATGKGTRVRIPARTTGRRPAWPRAARSSKPRPAPARSSFHETLQGSPPSRRERTAARVHTPATARHA